MKQSWKLKILTPFIFCVQVSYLGRMNKNRHIWIGSGVVAMVAALDHVDQVSVVQNSIKPILG